VSPVRGAKNFALEAIETEKRDDETADVTILRLT
jgi:hypothetical protein